jgi:hypothetical protein
LPGVLEIAGIISGVIMYTAIALLNAYTMLIEVDVANILIRRAKERGESLHIKTMSDLG